MTIFLAVFWIAGASAWAHGKSSVSESMEDTDVVSAYCKSKSLVCSNFFYESTKKLTISVVREIVRITCSEKPICILTNV